MLADHFVHAVPPWGVRPSAYAAGHGIVTALNEARSAPKGAALRMEMRLALNGIESRGGYGWAQGKQSLSLRLTPVEQGCGQGVYVLVLACIRYRYCTYNAVDDAITTDTTICSYCDCYPDRYHTVTVIQTATTAISGTNTTGLALIHQSPGKVQGHVDSREARHKVLH